MSIINGTAGDDTLSGTLFDDTITGGDGDDRIDGVGGSDVAVFSGSAAEYRLGVLAGYLTTLDTLVAGGNDGSDSLIRIPTLRFNDRDYTISSELRANSATAGDQSDCAAAGLAGGGMVVLWRSAGQDGDLGGIYAQRYDNGGNAQGIELAINTTTSGDQLDVAAVGLAGGGFVASWTSIGQDGSLGGVYAQVFSATGAPVGSEARVNTTTADEQRDSALGALSGGGFAVAWTSKLQDGSGEGVYARVFSATGIATSAAFRANTFTSGDQVAPAVAGLGGGGFLVVWQSLQQDGSSYGIYAQRFNASGVQQGTEFQVNTTVTGNQVAPAVAGLAGGGAVVTWASENQDDDGYAVVGQLLNAAGALVGTEFVVNTTMAKEQAAPSVSAFAAGGFVVSWRSQSVPEASGDGSGYCILAQRYDAAGVAQGAEFRANTTSAGHQLDPAIVTLSNEGLGIAWTSSLQDGDAGGIYAQVYDTQGSPTGPVVISGTAGDDTFDLSGTGALQAAGFDGDDTYIVNESADVTRESVASGTDAVFASISWTLASNIEDLTLSGASSIDGTGNGLDNRIDGNSGANVLDGLAGADTLAGHAGNDTYFVGSDDLPNEAAGQGTDEVISDSNWTLGANFENLALSGTAAISGTGKSLANTITGNSGNNLLQGGGQSDSLVGAAGDDTLAGAAGNDTLQGGPGDDVYTAGAGDLVDEQPGEGYDTVNSPVSWTLEANMEALTLTGTAGINATGNSDDNLLSGNPGANVIPGGSGDDDLFGNGGADTLSGGNGNDTLSGGGTIGIADTFVFNFALNALTNLDLVSDFQHSTDRIRLDDDVFTAFDAAVTQVLANAQFHKGAGVTAAHDAGDRIVYDTATGILYYDPDGIGGVAATEFARIGTNTHANLTAGDFQIVA